MFDPVIDGIGRPIDPSTLMMLRAIPGLSEDWLTVINDKVVAEVEQLLFNHYWDRSETDMFLTSNLLTTNTQGFHFASYEFDDDEQKHILRNLSVRQVYIDPTVEDIKDAAYVGFDWYMDKNEAKKHYPHLADAIENAKQTNSIRATDHQGDTPDAFSHNFQRDMVVLSVFWLRNQMIPYTLDEALGLQLVIEAPLPSEGAGDVGAAGDTVPALIENGLFLAAKDAMGNVIPGEPVAAPFEDEDGRTIFADNWPRRRWIRELVSVADKVEIDRACPHWGIPILHNVNIPISGKPYGHGEPYRLRKLQQANSSILDSMVQHAERFKTPMTAMMRSVYNEMKKEFGGAWRNWKRIIVPDTKWQTFMEGMSKSVQPPQMPPALPEVFMMTKQALTENSGHTEVLQGRANGQLSGRAIESLQTAATSLIGFKSQRTGNVVRRLARLMLHNLVNRLTVEHIERICSKYPRPVLEFIHQRAKQIEWNVTVMVESGSGEIVARKKAEIRQDYKDGLISWETAMEELGYDVAQEKRRMAQQQQQMALTAMQQGAQPSNLPAAA